MLHAGSLPRSKRNFSDLLPIPVDDASYCKLKKTKKINQYVLLKKVGAGASCKIYLSYDTLNKGHVAVKLFHFINNTQSHYILSSLKREVRTLESFKHENIQRFISALEAENHEFFCIVMEFMDSGSLEYQIKSGVKFTEPQIAYIFKQVVQGLMFLHECGTVHRDIKPSNILLNSSGKVVVADFGTGHSFYSAENVIGTPAYQAPEIYGEEDCNDDQESWDPVKEDVWSLGVSLYEVVYGKLPFSGSNGYEIAKSARESPLVLPDTASKEVRDLLKNMLSVRQSDRYNMEQVLESPFISMACKTCKLQVRKLDHGPLCYDQNSIEEIRAHEWSDRNSQSCSPPVSDDDSKFNSFNVSI